MKRTNSRFRSIVNQYQKPVYRQALRILGNVQDADDLTQDVFLSVFYNLDGFREQAQIGTWIYRVTANACLSYRRKSAQRFISLEEAELLDDSDCMDSGPEEEYIKRELYDQLESGVGELPIDESIAIAFCYYEDKSYDEIARIMQLPPGTVATLLYRGRAHLHTLLVSEKKKGRNR